MRWLSKTFAAGFALICLVSSALALDPTRKLSQYVHETWGADRGFIGGKIYALGQSADGYLWIGTDRGLVRFDGSRFALIQRPTPDSAPIGPVRSLVSDGEGNLWIRLESPRMLLYRDGKFEDADSRIDFQDILFTASASDNHGGVLLSGLGDRTFRYKDGRLETLVSAKSNPGTVISLTTTRDGKTWLGTQDNGLFRVAEGQIAKVAEALNDTKINALLPANNGGLWIGTDHGIQFWDGNQLTQTSPTSSMKQFEILALAKDQEGNVWAGTNHGIVRISPWGTASLDDLDLKLGHEVMAIFQDRDGDIWFGSSRGLERLSDGMFATYSVSEGLPSDRMGAVYTDSEGRTWFAPLAGGLYWMKDGETHAITAGGLNHDVVYSIAGRNGEIWLGRQRGGLSVLTSREDSFDVRSYSQRDGLAENSVYTVYCDREGAVWSGTVSAGVSRLDGGRFTNYSQADGLPSNSINSISQNLDGTVWLATPTGLASYANRVWKKFSVLDGLPSNDVRTIFEDSTHVLWIATSSGLAYFASSRIHVPIRLPDLLREQILGIAEDKMGTLWFVTSDHILRVNRDRLIDGTLADTDVQSYGIGDGLRGVEGAARDRTVAADHQGRIWISLNSGLSVADPKVTAINAIPVTARIESISAGGNQIDSHGSIQLPSGTQSIVLNFGSTNLAAPERVRFRYRLDGSNQGWSDIVASRQVVYTNLDPASYRFRVVASNRDGLWNGPETAVSFVIEPAFWQTSWFRVIGLAACLLTFLALYRLRMYQLTKRLNIRFQDRLAERTRIAQELHDTLLQGVLSASLQLDVADEQLPDGSPAKHLVRRVLELMRTVSEEGRNALLGLRTAERDKTSLESAFARVQQEFAFAETINFRVIADNVSRPLRPMIRDEVYRIGREAIVNAFVHAHATTIEVEVEYAARHLRVLVRDDGRGIGSDVLHSGRQGHWGLPGMRERAESIGASLRLRSRVSAGTEVDLVVPGPIAFKNGSSRPTWNWFSWLRRQRTEAPERD